MSNKELIAAVLSEDENGTFNLAFHLDDQSQHAQRVDQLLDALIRMRAGMQPPRSREVPKPGEWHEAIFGSAWWIDPTLTGDVALRLHHPALSWLTWALPAPLAREMATKMLEILDREAKPPSNLQ